MRELWDLYDADRRPLGKIHPRELPMKEGTYHVTVAVWIFNRKRQLLLTRRAMQKQQWPNKWENTAGSAISGEDSLTAAKRELYEETGIAAADEQLIPLGSFRSECNFEDNYGLFYEGSAENLRLQPGETVDAKWATFDEIEYMTQTGEMAEPIPPRFARLKKQLEDLMDSKKKEVPFVPADILLPKEQFDKWAVVACDQYTSQPDYWDKAAKIVGDTPSSLRITLPEVYLEEPDVAERIQTINKTMQAYEENGVLSAYPSAMVLVERTLADGRTRYGLVGNVDLAAYDYSAGSQSLIRATEGTVLSRIPPRVKIREGASLELPHIMILVDDPDFTVIPKKGEGGTLYDCNLMLGGGHIKGTLLTDTQINDVTKALSAMLDGRDNPLLFAVGDGNHSLATAKACCREEEPLSRYALAEIVNIHDPALDFEPIYRVMFHVDPDELIAAAKSRFAGCHEHFVRTVSGSREDGFSVDGLAAGSLQAFLDDYLKVHPEASVDYIHGEDAVRTLSEKEGAVGFLFDGIAKDELFPYVERHGALPRKTFSMGEAYDKRYYMECRKIRSH